MYKLNCTECGCVKTYNTKGGWYNAKKKLKDTNKLWCKDCQSKKCSENFKGNNTTFTGKPIGSKTTTYSNFFKECTKCGNKQFYKSESGLRESIRLGTICNSCSGIENKKGYKLNSILTNEQRQEAIAKRHGYNSYAEYDSLRTELDKYRSAVWSVTGKQPIHILPNIEKRGLCGVPGAYQLDHIIPITEGFKQNIPAEVIGNITNLQMLPWQENLKKSNK